jgi:hypothetical protein
MLKLPAGHCIFINPAYANQQEASIPMKLKVEIGDGEIQRRAYGEKHFGLVIKELKKKNPQLKITSNDIKDRIDSLQKTIPDQHHIKKEIDSELDKLESELESLQRDEHI